MNAKAFYLTLSLLFLTTFTFGQFEKGTILPGGSVNTQLDFSDGTTFSIFLGPQAGFFFSDRVVLGAGVNLGFSAGENPLTEETFTSFSYGLSPFARYYLVNDASLNWFLGAGLGLQGFTSDGNGRITTTGNLNAGFSLFPHPSVAFEPTLSLGFLSIEELPTRTLVGLNATFRVFLSQTDRGNIASVAPALRRGTLLIGGSTAGINLQTGGNLQEIINLSIRPNIGYFLSPQFALGLQLNFSYTDRGEDPFSGQRFADTGYGVIPFVRYYFDTSNRPWFLQGEIGLQGISSNQGGFEDFSDTDLLGFIGGGMNIFLTPVTAIEGVAGLNFADNDENTDVSLGLRIGLQLFLAPQKEEE